MRIVDSSGWVFGELDSLPGCSQVVVSHAVFNRGPRGFGHGSKAHSERLKLMYKLGYDYALCTVRADNLPQNQIMKKFGWHRLTLFTSEKTKSLIYIYGKPLYTQKDAL